MALKFQVLLLKFDEFSARFAFASSIQIVFAYSISHISHISASPLVCIGQMEKCSASPPFEIFSVSVSVSVSVIASIEQRTKEIELIFQSHFPEAGFNKYLSSIPVIG